MKSTAVGSIIVAVGLLVLVAARPIPAQEPKAAPPTSKEAARPKVEYPQPPPPPDEPPAPGEINLRDYLYSTDQAIQVFEARTRQNPKDAISFRYLGEMHERKARETGDLASYVRAEAALRQSLKLSPESPRARASLAAVLCARHKFAEGLAISKALFEENPKDIDALATMGDALLELGRYDEAEVAIKRLNTLAPYPEVLARVANLAELKGNIDEAQSLMREAAARARKGGGAKADAWYLARLGDIAWSVGRLDEAAKFYQSVPEGVDPYHDATAGLARIAAARGETDRAIALYKKAIAIGPDPHMLAALGDLYRHLGQPEPAQALFDQLEREAKGNDEHLRTLALFYADHDLKLPEALTLAEKDFASRQDLYGHDARAWALFKNGRAEEAARAIDEALKLGTKDARLRYHAGLIYHYLGDRAKAREHLSQALTINPHFSLAQADEARRTLQALKGEVNAVKEPKGP